MSTSINLDASKIKLTDFMEAMGYKPLKQEGKFLTYHSPYVFSHTPRMVVDTEKNTWRDTEDLLLYGGIYDLVYEMTGSCSRSELNLFIATKMSAIQKAEQSKPEPQNPKTGRKMRF